MRLSSSVILLCSTLTLAFGQLRCGNYRCENGGTCRASFHLICDCPPNYAGLHCQVPKRDATPVGGLPQCPRNNEPTICDLRACVVDQDCSGNKICCISGCGSHECKDLSTNNCEWSEWSSCRPFAPDLYCGRRAGRQRRTRPSNCIQSWEKSKEERSCDLGPCRPCSVDFGPWTAWGVCSVSCGTGVQKRTRGVGHPGSCTGPRVETNTRQCSGPDCTSSNPGKCVDETNQCANQGSQACRDDEYQGRKSVTLSGRTCQNWDSQSPQQHGYSRLGRHNSCRNPNKNTAPWCYTTDPDFRWDYCFPDCDPTPCRDKQTPSMCSDFVAKGECNPGHRHHYAAYANCCLSCKRSQDSSIGRSANSACEAWAKEGRCSSDSYVQQNCAHLCRVC